MPEKNKQNQKITEYFIDIFPMKFKSRLKTYQTENKIESISFTETESLYCNKTFKLSPRRLNQVVYYSPNNACRIHTKTSILNFSFGI